MEEEEASAQSLSAPATDGSAGDEPLAAIVPASEDVMAVAIPSDLVEHTIRVETPEGPKRWIFRFRRPRTTRDIANIWRGHEGLLRQGKWEVDGSTVYAGRDIEDATLVNVAFIRACLAEPELDEQALITMSQRNGPLLTALAIIARRVCGVSDWAEIEAAKKDSAEA